MRIEAGHCFHLLFFFLRILRILRILLFTHFGDTLEGEIPLPPSYFGITRSNINKNYIFFILFLFFLVMPKYGEGKKFHLWEYPVKEKEKDSRD